MKTAQKQITVYVCEECGKAEDTYPHCCTECGKHFCWDCSKRLATDYQHSLHCSGSGDGLYCVDCEANLTANPTPLFTAYAAIKTLRQASKAYYAALEKKAAELEKEIRRLREERERL
jgi:hypothetical protein